MQNQIPVLSTKSISCTENGPTKSIVPASTSTQCDETSVLSLSENIQGTSLSRDDWLAKFSSYLPSVSSREGNQVTVARAFYLASHSQLKGLIHHSSIPISSLNLSLPSDEAGNEQGKSSCQLTENGEMRNQDSGQKT
uniref:Uncharacterized protein n=2 Tax=Arion vulgaris TaxID=1028688 RepID=A0A0B6Z1L3_9EUPU